MDGLDAPAMANDRTAESASTTDAQDFREQMIEVASAVPGMIYSFRMSPDGVLSLPFTTPGIDNIFGVTPDELVKDFAGGGELLHPTEVARVQGSIYESARTMTPWRQEFRVRHPRKGDIWVEASSVPAREPDGSILWRGYMHEVTDRKLAEQVLHYKNQLLLAQQEASIDGILVINTDFSIYSMNSRFAELWGLPPELIESSDHHALLAFVVPQLSDPRAFTEKLEELYEKTDVRCHDELRLNDGRVIERHLSPISGEDGQCCGRLWSFRDVTAARKVQQALLESERFARSTLDSLSAHIAILDANGIILAVNRSWRAFAQENVCGDAPVLEGVDYLGGCESAPGGVDAFPRALGAGIREVLAGLKDEFNLEYPFHSATTQRWFAVRVSRFVGDGPTRLVVAHENITDRVLALNELRESKALLSEMGRAAKIGGWEVDPATGACSWTDEVSRIYGLDDDSPESVELALNFYVNEWRIAIEEAFQAALEDGTPYDLELAMETAEGVRKWVRTIGNPETKDGRVVRIRGSLQDITEKKKREIELRESEELFSTVFRVSPIAITIFRLSDGRTTMVNDAYVKLTGFHREELVGRSAAEMGKNYDPTVRARLLHELAMGRGETMIDARIPVKTGGTRDIMVSIHAVTLQGERSAVVVVIDITDRKLAEAKMKELQEQFLQSQKMEAVGRLAGGVAHDFNNLLQVINSYAEMITAAYSYDPTLVRYGKSIHHAGEIAANLTRQLLAFSRNAPAEPRKVELDAVLGGMKDMLRRLVGEDVTVHMNLAFPGRFIEVDPSQIEQVVLNLAVNSRDAMPKGGVLSLSTHGGRDGHGVAAADGSQPRELVELTVSDTGHGMSAEVQKKIFEPFFTTKPPGRGTGLGLSTVYGIVQQCGGSIEIESEPNVGTDIHLFFPLVEAPRPDAALTAASSDPGTAASRCECVLVVEDGEDLRELYQDTLTELGYRVLTADNGRSALQLITSGAGPFNLVVSDTVMPDMGGIELFEILQHEHPGLKLLLISGYAGDRVDHHKTLTNVDLLAKPFSLKSFADKVRQLLDSSSAAEALPADRV